MVTGENGPMKKFIALACLLAAGWSAHAAGLDSLEHFIKTAKSGRADFTQLVTGPAREGEGRRTKTSSGSFEFVRPNRFRFVYKKPFEQVIVADGESLWLYDVDLQQVTRRKQTQVLGSTPAALIAAAPDLEALRKNFNLENAGEKDGMQWVQATPKAKEGQLRSMKIGFRGEQLASLEILDGFGQRSVITFTKMELNAAIPPDTFNFKPPAKADVLDR
jgi:outer membrane lipoprotein carrier protein